MKILKVLVACEYSGTVRDAFAALGHDAISCDLLPSDKPGNHHQGDIFKFVRRNKNFDLLIGHPPCKFLSNAANSSFDTPGRYEERIKALRFFIKLYNAPIPHICLENPVGIINGIYKRPCQTIHPYFFGDAEVKRTCLWLKNLPNLHYSFSDTLFENKTSVDKPAPDFVWIRENGRPKHEYFNYRSMCKAKNKIHAAHLRSKTFPGIAQAMATQWSEYLIHKLIAA